MQIWAILALLNHPNEVLHLTREELDLEGSSFDREMSGKKLRNRDPDGMDREESESAVEKEIREESEFREAKPSLVSPQSQSAKSTPTRTFHLFEVLISDS